MVEHVDGQASALIRGTEVGVDGVDQFVAAHSGGAEGAFDRRGDLNALLLVTVDAPCIV